MNLPSKLSWLVRISICFAVAVTLSVAAAVADAPAPKRAQRQFEIGFMKDMIDHHNMAVEMAELCLDRAVHEKLEDLCHDVIEAQSAEIELMQSWLDDWYGISYEPRMSREMRKQLPELAQLEGEEFETEFMMMMIEHHATAINEAEDCVDRAIHEELVELCENIIRSQSRESRVMRRWLCKWYDMCQHGHN